jgi:hypothetical protein
VQRMEMKTGTPTPYKYPQGERGPIGVGWAEPRSERTLDLSDLAQVVQCDEYHLNSPLSLPQHISFLWQIDI